MAAYYFDLPILILLISLVYSATRFEAWPDILLETCRWVFRLVSFLVLIAVALWVVTLF
jgi:hypothetical protein